MVRIGRPLALATRIGSTIDREQSPAARAGGTDGTSEAMASTAAPNADRNKEAGMAVSGAFEWSRSRYGPDRGAESMERSRPGVKRLAGVTATVRRSNARPAASPLRGEGS